MLEHRSEINSLPHILRMNPDLRIEGPAIL